MAKSDKPSPQVIIPARDLKDLIRDELYDLQTKLDSDLPKGMIKEIAKTIVYRALRSPR